MADQAIMAQSITCLGHKEREDRMNKIGKLVSRPKEAPDDNLRVLIKRGPVSVETSLKDLEDNYKSKPEWKLIEDKPEGNIGLERPGLEVAWRCRDRPGDGLHLWQLPPCAHL